MYIYVMYYRVCCETRVCASFSLSPPPSLTLSFSVCPFDSDSRTNCAWITRKGQSRYSRYKRCVARRPAGPRDINTQHAHTHRARVREAGSVARRARFLLSPYAASSEGDSGKTDRNDRRSGTMMIVAATRPSRRDDDNFGLRDRWRRLAGASTPPRNPCAQPNPARCDARCDALLCVTAARGCAELARDLRMAGLVE